MHFCKLKCNFPNDSLCVLGNFDVNTPECRPELSLIN